MRNPGESSARTRVIVVDDRAEMAEMIADALCEHGYEGLAVTSGREALRVLRTERVDAMVTDLRMPEIDGLALLDASRELDPSRPVIVMTAYGTLETAIESNGRGALQYLTKPFRLDALVRALQQALGGG
jgi:two-component system, NtrC family, response regulator HydG